MQVKVLFFGSTADIAGTKQLDLHHEENLRSEALLKQMVEKFPDFGAYKLHLSINQKYAIGDEVIRDGDELAIFTAVSGG